MFNYLVYTLTTSRSDLNLASQAWISLKLAVYIVYIILIVLICADTDRWIFGMGKHANTVGTSCML